MALLLGRIRHVPGYDPGCGPTHTERRLCLAVIDELEVDAEVFLFQKTDDGL